MLFWVWVFLLSSSSFSFFLFTPRWPCLFIYFLFCTHFVCPRTEIRLAVKICAAFWNVCAQLLLLKSACILWWKKKKATLFSLCTPRLGIDFPSSRARVSCMNKRFARRFLFTSFDSLLFRRKHKAYAGCERLLYRSCFSSQSVFINKERCPRIEVFSSCL